MKAIRSLEQHVDSLIFGDYDKLTDDELLKELEKIDDLRIYVIAEAIRRGFDYDTIFNITKIDRWFLDKIAVLVEMEKKLAQADTLDKAVYILILILFGEVFCLCLVSKSRCL